MLANPYVAVGAAIAGAGVAWFNYNKKLEESKMLTEQFLGITGNSLDSVRAKIQSLSTVYKKEYRDILAGTETIMRQFGISAEKAVSVLQDGFVAGADDSGKLLEMLDKFGPALRDAGLAADEAMALISQTRSGLFNEKALELIKEAGKNFRTMRNEGKTALSDIGIDYDKLANDLNNGSINMIDIIRKVSTEINKLPEGSTQAARAMKALYSKKFVEGGEQLIRSFATLSTNMAEVKTQTGEIGRVQQELIDATAEWEMALDSLFGSSQDGFSTFMTRMKTQVLVALTKCIDSVIDLYNSTGLVRGVIQGIWALIKTIVNYTQYMYKSTIEFIKVSGRVIESIMKGDFSAINKAVKDYTKARQELSKEYSKDLEQNFSKAWNETKTGKIKRITFDENAESSTSTSTVNQNTNINTNVKTTGAKKSKEEIAALTGSLAAYKKELQDIQEQRDKGIISPDLAKTEITRLEKLIEKKEIELGIKPEIVDGSLKDLESQLSDINSKIQNGEYFELNPEIEITQQELLTAKAELENKIDKIKVKIEFEVEKQKLDFQAVELLVKPKIETSSFEKVLQPLLPEVNSPEFKLTGIEEQMNLNDALISDIQDLMKEYEELGATGSEAYSQLTNKLSELNVEQQKLGEDATTTFKQIEDGEKSSKTFEAIGSSVGDFGSALSSIGSAFELPELNVAGVIAQGISQMVLGAGEAIAQASALGPIGWIAASLSIVGTLAAIIAQAKAAASFASGGIVHSGLISGDLNTVRVNGNEMILNDT